MILRQPNLLWLGEIIMLWGDRNEQQLRVEFLPFPNHVCLALFQALSSSVVSPVEAPCKPRG